MHNIRAVVFDLDDTLYPERQFVQSGFHAVSAHLRVRATIKDDIYPLLWEKFRGGVRGTVFNEVLGELGIAADDALIRELVDVYRGHAPVISLYPDAPGALAFCSRRCKTGLLSDGPALMQRNKIIALSIRSFFNAVMLTDVLGREFWKPHAAGYENIRAALGVPADMCLYVGDNPAKDFLGARRLGWKTVQVKRPDGIYADAVVPAENMADRCIASLEELREMLV